MSRQIAHFTVTVQALDKPTDRTRWNGGPMSSGEADMALYAAVEAFQRTLKEHGFHPAHTQYGVHATD